MSGAELILDARNATGESPVWRTDAQALYWADIPRGVLHRWQAAQAQHYQWQLPRVDVLALTADGQVDTGGIGRKRRHRDDEGGQDTLFFHVGFFLIGLVGRAAPRRHRCAAGHRRRRNNPGSAPR